MTWTRPLGLLFASTLVACLPPVEEPAPVFPDLDDEVESATLFATAAENWGVPADLLVAIAWHESSLTDVVHNEDGHHEHRPVHGWMGLNPDNVALAAEITGWDPAAIEEGRAANIEAGAAVLDHLRDAVAPDAPSTYVDHRWWDVVVAWSGFEESWMDHDFAFDVFRTLQLGRTMPTADDETLVIPPHRMAGLHEVDYEFPPVGSEERDSIGYPERARYLPAHSSNQSSRSNGTNSIERIVIHTTEGSYNGAISWFRNSSANVSAHYVIRKSDGEVTQMVRDADKAWHACGNNNDTIGIEHEGAAYNASTWTPQILEASARLSAWLVNEYDIPIDRDHIVGHGEIQPSHCSGRSDPGPYFPWDDYMDMVATFAGQSASTPTPPEPPSSGGWGPLTFLSPTDGDTVGNPVTASVQHPDSHIELWSGPALVHSHIFEHPAVGDVPFPSLGNRPITARAYRLSGSHLATRTIWVEVAEPQPDTPEPAPEPEPADTELHGVIATPVGGTTVRFTASAGDDVARVEYWIEGWQLPDDATGQRYGTPGDDFELTYTFNYTGVRGLEARAIDADGNVTDTVAQQIDVPDADAPTPACAGDVCVSALPYSDSNSTSGAARDAWDYYSCAPGTNESGPEVVYQVTVADSGVLTAAVSDGAGVDVDVHILSALDPDSCLDRGHHEAAAWVGAGTWYVVVDSWVNSSGSAQDGAYDLDIGFTGSTAYAGRGLSPQVMGSALQAYGAARAEAETDSLLLTVIDFSLPSTRERLWTVDLADGDVLWELHVSHGENSGDPSDWAMASSFSNTEGSHQSSLGLMKTAETYWGSNGYSLRLDGLEPGYNDNVRDRYIVIHGSTYSRPEFAAANGYLGRSWGCPSVDDRQATAFIDDVKGGSMVFSWYPDGDWQFNSTWFD